MPNKPRKNLSLYKCIWKLILPVLILCMAKEGIVFAKTKEKDFDRQLYARAAVLIDGTSQRMLYGKNPLEPLPMASTTKIMTCITVLEEAALDEQVSVSAYAAGMPKVKLYVKKGETYLIKDLLYSTMLESHNDSAVVLAEYVGKKYVEHLKDKEQKDFTEEESREAVAAFAKLMNERAQKIGCRDTWFITPNGLDQTQEIRGADNKVYEKSHHTTALDLACIMSYCLDQSVQQDRFLEITSTQNYEFVGNSRTYHLSNHNAFLHMMTGAISGKTGFTNLAGYCYVGALKRDDRLFIVALLACGWPNNKSYKWTDTRLLMEYGIDHFRLCDMQSEKILADSDGLDTIVVENAKTKNIGDICILRPVIANRREKTDNTKILLRTDEQITRKINMTKKISAPVYRDTVIGSIEYYLEGEPYMKEDILAGENIGKIDFGWCIQKITLLWLSMGKLTKA